jgi:hypothetical protein
MLHSKKLVIFHRFLIDFFKIILFLLALLVTLILSFLVLVQHFYDVFVLVQVVFFTWLPGNLYIFLYER